MSDDLLMIVSGMSDDFLYNENFYHVILNQQMRLIVGFASVAFYILLYFVLTLFAPSNQDQLKQLHTLTGPKLHEMIQTKFFRIIRLNVNQQCPLAHTSRLCKSTSCRVCRCEEKDIPGIWHNSDRVSSRGHGIEEWSSQRIKSNDWIWHVEDEENDEGEYFDIYSNVEAYTNYNGSFIWQLIYEENCFGGKNKVHNMCDDEQVLYRIISGLHTSISTHLSAYYAAPVAAGMEWMQKEPVFTFNHSQYKKRVLNHPQRINNLLFLYQIVAKAIKEIAPVLMNNYTIRSDNITEDLRATTLLKQLLSNINSTDLIHREKQAMKFFSHYNPKVKEYQKYIHNISRIMNCVDCQKCKIFGKMQTYGIGTALKILLGYKEQFNRNEIVALFNLFNKISISVGYFYQYGPKEIELDHLKSPFNIFEMWYFMIGMILVIVYIFSQVDLKKKVKKQFRHTFPSNKKMRIE